MKRERIWTPHKDYSGGEMRPGEFRDPQCEQCELAAINPEFLACKHCATGYRQ